MTISEKDLAKILDDIKHLFCSYIFWRHPEGYKGASFPRDAFEASLECLLENIDDKLIDIWRKRNLNKVTTSKAQEMITKFFDNKIKMLKLKRGG